ncbi:hypothetical protein Q5752_004443 [Cryptotrichosporon argae]
MPPAPGQSREDYEREKRKKAEAAAAAKTKAESSSSSSSAATKPSASEKAAKEAKEAKRREEKKRRYAKEADPSTVLDVVGGDEAAEKLFKDGRWAPSWAPVEFDEDACLANVTKAGKTNEGFFVPAGSMLPLGAVMPPMTVLKYGGYFPAGTAFRGGVLVPLHARMVNILPQEAKEAAGKYDEPLCCVQ